MNTLRAVQKRSTVFVQDLFHRPDGATVSSIIWRCGSAEYRVWLWCMMGIYLTQTYPHRMGLVPSQLCPHCTLAVPETLVHFACVCPKFREARLSAHNQVCHVITSFLTPLVVPHWKVYEETQMNQTGLTLCPVPAVLVAQALGASLENQSIQSFLHQLTELSESCRLQLESDNNYGVPWSRHLLTNIQQVTGAELLIGASAVTYNPVFLHYASPFPVDTNLRQYLSSNGPCFLQCVFQQGTGDCCTTVLKVEAMRARIFFVDNIALLQALEHLFPRTDKDTLIWGWR